MADVSDNFNLDADFELVPADGTILSAEDALNAALDTALGTVEQEPTQQPPLPFGRGWAFDFGMSQFKMHGHGPREVHGVDNLVVWIEKTLRTARYAHPIYSDAYGIEYVDVVGKPFTPALAGAYARAVRDVLLIHDRIEEVKDFTFSGDPDLDMLSVAFRVTLIGDEELSEVIIGPLLVGAVELGTVEDPALLARAQTTGGA